MDINFNDLDMKIWWKIISWYALDNNNTDQCMYIINLIVE